MNSQPAGAAELSEESAGPMEIPADGIALSAGRIAPPADGIALPASRAWQSRF